jgi:hypothetical protein
MEQVKSLRTQLAAAGALFLVGWILGAGMPAGHLIIAVVAGALMLMA